MKALILAGLASVALLAPPVAHAQPAVAAASDGLDYLVGRWSASVVDPTTGETVEVDYRVEPTSGGAWLTGTGVARDGSLNARDIWGRDPLTKEIIRVVFDGSGALGTIRSPGWQGERLVLEGDVRSSGGTVRVRETLTRMGPNRFKAVWEAQRDGAWSAYSVETLVRQI